MHIQIITFLLYSLLFSACHNNQVLTPISATNIGFQTTAPAQANPEKPQSSATNIILQSTDSGQTWQDVSAGLPEDLELSTIYTGNNELLLGTEAGLFGGIMSSTTPVWTKESLLDKRISDIFPGSAGPYVLSYWSGFYQMLPGTNVWMPMFNNIDTKLVRAVFEASNGSILIATDYGISKSSDRGKTWKKVFDEGMVLNFTEVNGVILGGGFKGVLRSTDGGKHWDWVLNGDGVAMKTGHMKGNFAAIMGGNKKSTMHTSTDGGKTWNLLQGGGLPSDGFINDFEQLGQYQFCSHTAGIFRSSDQGKTWSLMLAAVGKERFDLAVLGNTLFLARMVFGGC